MDIIQKYWKPSADWVTGSGDRVFRRAHIKLTFCYMALLAFILCICSSFMYFSLRKNIRTSFVAENGQDKAAAVEQTLDSLKNGIISVDGTVMVIGSLMSYIIAGGMLRPVRKTYYLQREFSANASHELRTPLAIMKTDSEVLLRSAKNSKEDLRLLTERNLEEIDRMSEIVENLLFLSRGGEMVKARKSRINLSKTVRRLIEKMQKMALDKQITIVLERAEKGFVLGSRISIEQAILNIFQNAVNYTPCGGKISVAVRSFNNNMVLLVRDNGIGIAKKNLPRIFERFYKAEHSLGSHKSGAGLGLAIVKEIIESHEGKIRINSSPGKGTSVSVLLPRAVD